MVSVNVKVIFSLHNQIVTLNIVMIMNNSNSDPVKKIDNLINLIKKDSENTITGIFLDETLTECFFLRDEINIPSIPVMELDYNTGYNILAELADSIPEYLFNHVLLEKRKPSSEQHTLQLIRPVAGRLIDYVHILRLDFKLAGGYGRITGKGDTRTFPGFVTDRIKYRSRLVPVPKGSDPFLLDSIRLKTQFDVDADGKRFTSVLFDEFNTAEISIELSSKVGEVIYSIPVKLFQFIVYDYFTACLNIPDPSSIKIEESAVLFEPLFFSVFFQYRSSIPGIEKDLLSAWDEYIDIKKTGISLKPLFMGRLKDYFYRYTLYRDEQLMLSGLRKFIITQ